jgi:hypothetical protein
MKTAAREKRKPNHGVNRAHGAVGQNRSRSIKWAEKQEKVQPEQGCFFLTSPFIELTRTYLMDGFTATAGALACISWFILRLRTAAA